MLTAAVGDGYFDTLRIPLVAGRSSRLPTCANLADVAVSARRSYDAPGLAPLQSAAFFVSALDRSSSSALRATPGTSASMNRRRRSCTGHWRFTSVGDRRCSSGRRIARRLPDGARPAAVRAIDPGIAPAAVTAFADDIGHALLPQRVAALITGILGVSGLTLAAIGSVRLRWRSRSAPGRGNSVCAALSARASSTSSRSSPAGASSRGRRHRAWPRLRRSSRPARSARICSASARSTRSRSAAPPALHRRGAGSVR